jgi:hypothetical protein
VKKEYVEAYNRHKNNIRRRNPKNSTDRQTSNVTTRTEKAAAWPSSASVEGTSSDPDRDQDAAMEEAMDDDGDHEHET